jgi:hypothetical protein
MLKRKKHQDEKEEGFIKKLFQRVKEISFYSYMLSFLIAVLLLILFLIYSENRNRDLKVPQTVVQSQIEIVPKEKFSKNEEVYLNETAKSNLKNFDVFISKKSPNTGLFLIRPSDIISKKDKIVLSDSVNTVEISGNPEILRNLEWSLSTASKSINITPNSIKIELNSKENTVFSFNLKNLELLGEYLNSNFPLLSVTYTESYAE